MMKNHALKLLFVALMMGGAVSATAVTAPVAHAAADQATIDANTTQALTDFQNQIKGAGGVLKNAKGVLVIPHVVQGGFVVGGEYGKGELLVNGQRVGFYKLTQGSVGFQIGGQRKDIILAFMTDSALNHFQQSSGFEVGADAAATVVMVGGEGDLDSEKLQKPILGFIVGQKGLMADLSLQGTKITEIKVKH